MEKNVLILGANGQIARIATDMLLDETEVNITLFLRRSNRLNHFSEEEERVTIIDGDVLDLEKLNAAMAGQDIVYANLDGADLEKQAINIITAMVDENVKRLIFVSAGGIYDELPGEFGEWNKRMLGDILIPYQKSVEVIENSDLVDYTILRPVWLTNQDEINYETTKKKKPLKVRKFQEKV